MSSNPKPFSSQPAGPLAPVTDRQGLVGLAVYVRTAWFLYLAIILSYMIAGLPLVLAQNHTACLGAGCLDWQLSAEGIQRLGESGIPISSYVWYASSSSFIITKSFWFGFATPILPIF